MQQAVNKIVLFSLVIAFFVLLPTLAFSEVKVNLNNGRSIIADECLETGEKLVCRMMGGSFELDKRDIENITGIMTGRKSSEKGKAKYKTAGQAEDVGRENENGGGKNGGDTPDSDM